MRAHMHGPGLCMFKINWINSSGLGGGHAGTWCSFPLLSFFIKHRATVSRDGTSYTLLVWGTDCLRQQEADIAEKLVTWTMLVGSHDLLRRPSHQTHKWPTAHRWVLRWSHLRLLWGTGWDLTQKSSEGKRKMVYGCLQEHVTSQTRGTDKASLVVGAAQSVD